MTATCYLCDDLAAGTSAFCPSCQPRDPHPLPAGTRVSRCSFCGLTFASTGLFDLHIRQGENGTIHRYPSQILDGGYPLKLTGGKWTSTRPARVQNSPESAERGELDRSGGQVPEDARDTDVAAA